MSGTSEMKDVKSPEEIEEEILSAATVTWDPFTVLPKEIYLMIFNMLDDEDDKHNFMNSHMKFYELFKSTRVLFLFDEVINQVISSDYEGVLNLDTFNPDGNEMFSRFKNCRLICRDWDSGFQNFFQYHSSHFMLDQGDEIWSPNSDLRMMTYESMWEPCNSPTFFSKEDVDKKLERFSVTHPPSRNPIFSRSITLFPFGYGPDGEILEDFEGYRTSVDTLLEEYGRQIWHCRIQIEEKLDPEACICIGKWISLMPELKTLWLKNEEIEPLSTMDLREIANAQVIQSEIKKLVVLKSSYIPGMLFSKLVGSLPKLKKIQIRMFQGEEGFLSDFHLMVKKENLKEAFLTLKGFEDFEFLQGSQPFPNLKKLSITLEFETEWERKDKYYLRWPCWKMIFEILEKKFPALEDLSLRLPKAVSKEVKRAVIEQSLECKLNLPKLKKLWVALPNLCSLDFLYECKKLEELNVVLEHSEWDWMYAMRGREKINFNMDLGKMWESNIWEVFPDLCKLKIWAWNAYGSYFDRYTYERDGEKRKYQVWTNPENQSVIIRLWQTFMNSMSSFIY